eukprot:GHRR01032837.1.p1 GENE.GHRR01032837.1~~GHRR01032837.1.p1  ORF type:complete len:194 (-),score=39.18 GHRR01032837.1:115-696(-)
MDGISWKGASRLTFHLLCWCALHVIFPTMLSVFGRHVTFQDCHTFLNLLSVQHQLHYGPSYDHSCVHACMWYFPPNWHLVPHFYANIPAGHTIFEDLEEDGPSQKGRITAMTVAEGLDRKKIELLLKAKYPKLETHTYQDVVHATPKLDDPNSGDIFFFDVSGIKESVVLEQGLAQQQKGTFYGAGAVYCAHG